MISLAVTSGENEYQYILMEKDSSTKQSNGHDKGTQSKGMVKKM